MTGLLKLLYRAKFTPRHDKHNFQWVCTNLLDIVSDQVKNSPILKKNPVYRSEGLSSLSLAWSPVVLGQGSCTLHYNSANLGCDSQGQAGAHSLSLGGPQPPLLLASRPGPAGSSAQLSTSKPCQHWLVKTVPALLHPFSSAFVREIIQDLHSFLETFVW